MSAGRGFPFSATNELPGRNRLGQQMACARTSSSVPPVRHGPCSSAGGAASILRLRHGNCPCGPTTTLSGQVHRGLRQPPSPCVSAFRCRAAPDFVGGKRSWRRCDLLLALPACRGCNLPWVAWRRGKTRCGTVPGNTALAPEAVSRPAASSSGLLPGAGRPGCFHSRRMRIFRRLPRGQRAGLLHFIYAKPGARGPTCCAGRPGTRANGKAQTSPGLRSSRGPRFAAAGSHAPGRREYGRRPSWSPAGFPSPTGFASRTVVPHPGRPADSDPSAHGPPAPSRGAR